MLHLTRSIQRTLGVAAAAVTLGVGASTSLAVNAFTDTFAYADAAAMAAGGWVNTGTGTPNVNTNYGFTAQNWTATTSGATATQSIHSGAYLLPTLTNQTLAQFNNASMTHDIGITLDASVATSITYTANVAVTSYSRTPQIMLLNSSNQGYLIAWQAGTPNQNSGFGAVQMRRLDSGVITGIGTGLGGTQLGATTPATAGAAYPTGYVLPPGDLEQPASGAGPNYGYNPIPYAVTAGDFQGYAAFSLTWEAGTGLLTLAINGNTILTATDTTYSSFSRIGIFGGTTTYADAVNVDYTPVPEPASLALLGLGALAMVRRRR